MEILSEKKSQKHSKRSEHDMLAGTGLLLVVASRSLDAAKSSLLEEQAEILLLKYNFLADFTAALTAAHSVANICLWTVSRMALQRRSALLRFRQAALAASFNPGTEGRSLIRLVIKGAWRSRI